MLKGLGFMYLWKQSWILSGKIYFEKQDVEDNGKNSL